MPILAEFDSSWKREAFLSSCGKYRYSLHREWEKGGNSVTFIMLNPSTADHEKDDPTIRRCIGFARRWGFGSLWVGNLFALRSPSPRALIKEDDPIGKCNDATIRQLVEASVLVVAAWGTKGHLFNRDAVVKQMLQSCKCLGFTKWGFPRHPLHLPYDSALLEFPGQN